jgi:hypothetical protein
MSAGTRLQPFDDSWELGPIVASDSDVEIYDAKSLETGERARLKLFRDKVDEDSDRLLEFATLARKLSGMNEASLLGIMSFGCVDGTAYVACQPFDGEPLPRVSGLKDIVPPFCAVRMIAHLYDEIACAHRLGFVHGALAPSSILLSASGEVRIDGFGIAELAAVLRGQPSTASPDADIQGLGAVSAILLGGRGAGEPMLRALPRQMTPVRSRPQPRASTPRPSLQIAVAPKPIEPVAQKPVAPVVPQTLDLIVPQPAAPMPQAVAPVVSRAAAPAVSQAAAPAVSQPVAPAVSQPVAPVVSQAFAPAVSQPVPPAAQKPVDRSRCEARANTLIRDVIATEARTPPRPKRMPPPPPPPSSPSMRAVPAPVLPKVAVKPALRPVVDLPTFDDEVVLGPRGFTHEKAWTRSVNLALTCAISLLVLALILVR